MTPTWTESELAEVKKLCKTLPLNEAWSIVANDKLAGLQALQVMGEETMFKLVAAEKRVAELEAHVADLEDDDYVRMEKENCALRARVAELEIEAERCTHARHPKAIADMNEEIKTLRARIAELEAAIIERCAQVAEQSGGFPTYYIDAEKVAAAIRALISAASPPDK